MPKCQWVFGSEDRAGFELDTQHKEFMTDLFRQDGV